jgi:simple sugar transport system ATP-binding protein
MVHQHFKLVPSFTIAQNIMLGMEPNRLGLLRPRDEEDAVRDLADRFGLPVDPSMRVRDLSVGMQQRVEILKSLQRNIKILILDEPTAVLTPQEVDELIQVVRGLADRGQSIVFITHKLVEVTKVADRVSVMRSGEMIGTKNVAETDIPDMARMMVGRDVLFRVKKEPAKPGKPVFETQNLFVLNETGLPAIRDFSMSIHAGEIYGIAGVSGNGQTELVDAIAGARKIEMGHIAIQGVAVTRQNVEQRRKNGMAHIPEDRIHVGLNLETSLEENTLLSREKTPEFNRFGILKRSVLRDFARSVIEKYSVVGASPTGGIVTLSGGNMQKVVIGRELDGDPDFIIANQPTRGLDVGSIEFVHRTLIEARDRGAAILLVSVELEEIKSLSDRVGVIFRGELAGEFPADQVTEQQLGVLMAGGALEPQET